MALTTILKANLVRSTNAMLRQFDVAMVRGSTLHRTYEIADAEEPTRLLVPAAAEAERWRPTRGWSSCNVSIAA